MVLRANLMQQLTSDKIIFLNQILGLQAERVTAGALGKALIWCMLLPKWATVWSSRSRPGACALLSTLHKNGRSILRQIAVLMSEVCLALSAAAQARGQQDTSSHAKEPRTKMKAAGTEIETVGFDLQPLPLSKRAIAENTLSPCASSIEHVYRTFDLENLQSRSETSSSGSRRARCRIDRRKAETAVSGLAAQAA